MIVVLDGIDRVGKTTIANLLCNKLGFKCLKIANEFPYDDQAHNVDINAAIIGMLNIVDREKENIVIDRFIMTEFVYGIIDREDDEVLAFEVFTRQASELSKLDNVIMAWVEPYDIDMSIALHGSDLKRHNSMFEHTFMLYEGNKIRFTLKQVEGFINYVTKEMNHETSTCAQAGN